MMEVRLSRGLVALVDDDDYESVISVGSWYADPSCGTYYARRNQPYRTSDGTPRWRTIKMHQFLTGWTLVDHINGNGLDNRRSNLRPATWRQNAMNRRLRSDNTSGFKGVNEKRGRFISRIQVDGERISLGSFRTAIEAALAYDEAARQHFGEFATLNFPRNGQENAA